jgi:hypothetical protein
MTGITYNYLECGGGEEIAPPARAAIPPVDPIEAMTARLFHAFEVDEDERRDPFALEVYRKAARRLLSQGEVLDSRREGPR